MRNSSCLGPVLDAVAAFIFKGIMCRLQCEFRRKAYSSSCVDVVDPNGDTIGYCIEGRIISKAKVKELIKAELNRAARIKTIS